MASHLACDDSSMNASGQTNHARLAIYAALLITIAVYWSGLKGPFLLDDLPNLNPLQRWLDGRATALELIFGNTSGMLGRPVSMLTLWASAATGGLHPFPFKLGNLVIHLLCGLAGWQMLKHLLTQNFKSNHRASLVAAGLVTLWLLHPLNVSTVLYAVQRMAQLSTLFVLLSVWAYLAARQQLAGGEVRSATMKLFLLFPLLLVTGLLSKENAAVAPALCLVVEAAYFLHAPRGGKALPAFFTLFLLLPALAALVLLALSPDTLLGAYVIREFTLSERLLTQPRALMEYLGLMFWPRIDQMGVFVDNFGKSTSLLSPTSTVLSILGLLTVSGFAIAVRRRAPAVFAGWFFFLVAHSIESSFLPLELYFDHRNYLPSFGILLALAGLFHWSCNRLSLTPGRQATVGAAVLGTLSALLAWQAWQQVQVWRSMDSIVEQALNHRPDSTRALLQRLTDATRAQDWNESLLILSRLQSSNDPQQRFLGLVHSVTIDCLRGDGNGMGNLELAEHVPIERITLAEVQAYTPLSLALGQGYCGSGITPSGVADSIVRVLNSLDNQPDTTQPKWLLRTTAADLYQRAENWQDAQRQAELAWFPNLSDTAIGAMLVRIYIHNGDKQAAQRTLDEARARVKKHERVANTAIQMDQAAIDAMPDR